MAKKTKVEVEARNMISLFTASADGAPEAILAFNVGYTTAEVEAYMRQEEISGHVVAMRLVFEARPEVEKVTKHKINRINREPTKDTKGTGEQAPGA